ncbi:MAG TPA: hypothetical protein VNV66_20650, partial [Pilimelia sp.]|nr:hypothetical protein [Pilimelia sp.]
DGSVDAAVVEMLLAALGADERLDLWATRVAPAARAAVAAHAGSRVGEIPEDLVRAYRSPTQLHEVLVANGAAVRALLPATRPRPHDEPTRLTT